MEIKVNKEVRDYTETVIIYLSCVDILGMETTSWLCMLGAAPFASLGFITFQK